MRHELRLFFIALQFLTRCPVPRWVGFEPTWLQQCVRWFPVVGILVGGFAALVLWGALMVWPPMVAVGLSMASSVWLTGGFHEDGWADTCDGLGGAVSREKALLIMKDSRIGSYGALGLILMLSLKAACLVTLAEAARAGALLALIWAHGASRAAAVALMHVLSYAGDIEHAKAKPLATQAGPATLAAAWGWVGLLGAAMAWAAPRLLPSFGLALVAVIATTWLVKCWLWRRLGGYTGDTLGACQQLAELAALLAFTALAK